MKFDYQYRKGRTYTDFTSFMEQNPKLPIVEMDTVIGARNSGKVLLTILFRDTNFMLIFLCRISLIKVYFMFLISSHRFLVLNFSENYFL